MAETIVITADERFTSRRGGTGDFSFEEREFVIRGSDDTIAIDNAVLAHADAPAEIVYSEGTLYRTGIRNREQQGSGLWYVTVAYESNEYELALGQKRVRWSTTGGMQRFLYAREHIATYDENGATTTTGADGILGFDGRTINGADVVVPVFNFEVDKPVSSVAGLAATVLSLTGKRNSASFYGFAVGEVLYLGASRSDRGNGIKDITHYFAAQPNRWNVAVGPSVTIPAVGAWDVISVATENSATYENMKPKRVHLDRVYDAGDMSLLGIGTSE